MKPICIGGGLYILSNKALANPGDAVSNKTVKIYSYLVIKQQPYTCEEWLFLVCNEIRQTEFALVTLMFLWIGKRPSGKWHSFNVHEQVWDSSSLNSVYKQQMRNSKFKFKTLYFRMDKIELDYLDEFTIG